VRDALKTFGTTKSDLQRHVFDHLARGLSFMSPYGKQSKAQKKAHARYLAKFMRLTKSIPLSEWGSVYSTITKHFRKRWLLRTNNVDYVIDPPALIKLQDMELPPILDKEREFVSLTRASP
jgi:hypothetical protein